MGFRSLELHRRCGLCNVDGTATSTTAAHTGRPRCLAQPNFRVGIRQSSQGDHDTTARLGCCKVSGGGTQLGCIYEAHQVLGRGHHQKSQTSLLLMGTNQRWDIRFLGAAAVLAACQPHGKRGQHPEWRCLPAAQSQDSLQASDPTCDHEFMGGPHCPTHSGSIGLTLASRLTTGSIRSESSVQTAQHHRRQHRRRPRRSQAQAGVSDPSAHCSLYTKDNKLVRI